MLVPSGMDTLQAAARRIVAAYLLERGALRAEIIRDSISVHGHAVDLVVIDPHESRRIKLKADPYCGSDPHKISNRDLSYYRPAVGSFAFEAVANSATRDPGWTLVSDAQDLYYYFLALAQTPAEVRALMDERDEVFFSELAVEHDELVVMPMPLVRAWFEERLTEYAARPVMLDGAAAWCRLVPRADVEREITGVRSVGSIFASLAR